MPAVRVISSLSDKLQKIRSIAETHRRKRALLAATDDAVAMLEVLQDVLNVPADADPLGAILAEVEGPPDVRTMKSPYGDDPAEVDKSYSGRDSSHHFFGDAVVMSGVAADALSDVIWNCREMSAAARQVVIDYSEVPVDTVAAMLWLQERALVSLENCLQRASIKPA